jgi:hypothetical protein
MYLLNSIKTPDGTILVSKNIHDYVSHIDKNGQYYAVDGGEAYLKRGFDKVDYEELSIKDDGEFETRRKYLHWGKNYDKDMNRLDRTIWQTIDKLDTGHIEAIIDGGFCKDEIYLDTFKKELELRNK